MKEHNVSFFWRIFSAFIICGIVPLFLLAVVFTGTVQYVIMKNNFRRGEESIEYARQYTDNLIKQGFAIAKNLSENKSVIEYCNLSRNEYLLEASYEEHKSVLVSNIFQKTKNFEEQEEYGIFVIPIKEENILSKKDIPFQYNFSTYENWGIFKAANSILKGEQLFFGQPHPEAGSKTIAGILSPIFSNEQLIGYVIVDILRKGIVSQITQINGLQSSLDTLIIYDKNNCILYSHFNSETEGLFFDSIVPEKNHLVHNVTSQENNIFFYGVQPESGTSQYVKDLRNVALLIGLFTGAISLIAATFFSKSITKPVQSLTKAISAVEAGDLTVKCQNYFKRPSSSKEMIVLISCFNNMVDRLKDQVTDIIEKQNRIRIAEIKTLQAQINPHFLYNTLNSIKSTAKLANDTKVATMVTSLGKILRYEFEPGQDFSPLEKELEMAKNYFEIESYRWEGRFSFSEKIDSNILSYPFPRLVIQPLIENALLHGLEEKTGNGKLEVVGTIVSTNTENDTQEKECDILIEVKDDGIGISDDRLLNIKKEFAKTKTTTKDSSIQCFTKSNTAKVEDSNGIALINTHLRLKLLYGNKYGLEISSERNIGTTISFRIPYKTNKRNK